MPPLSLYQTARFAVPSGATKIGLRGARRSLASPISAAYLQPLHSSSHATCVSLYEPMPTHYHFRSASTFSRAPRRKSPSASRGPASSESTQTDFGALDVLANTPTPTTAVDACTDDGFALNSGKRVDGVGVLLVGGEAFKWRPWEVEERQGSSSTASNSGAFGAAVRLEMKKVRDAKGRWDVGESAWGLLDVVWPKPDLLIIGTGKHITPISPETRRRINELGIRVEVQDTRNAAAQFNLLATERGVEQVAAALLPAGWS